MTKQKSQPENRPVKRRFSQDFLAGGQTQQNFKASCDVNVIVAHYKQTGLDPYADRIGKQSFGFATSRDFSEAMRQTAEVNSAFASLPSTIRSEFDNNAAAWFDSILTPPPDPKEITPPESPQEPLTPSETPSDTPENTPKTKALDIS